MNAISYIDSPCSILYAGIADVKAYGMIFPANRRDAESITDREAKLTSLYEEYYDRITRYAYLRVNDRDEAEDIAAEVFLRAFKSLKTYQEHGVPIQAWLFRIAHNLVIDYWRKRGKHKTVPIDMVTVETGVDPADVAERNIELERVTRAMEQLTVEQREIVGLRFFGGLTSKEVGGILNKSDGAVREMQRAAIEKLRRLLGAGS